MKTERSQFVLKMRELSCKLLERSLSEKEQNRAPICAMKAAVGPNWGRVANFFWGPSVYTRPEKNPDI